MEGKENFSGIKVEEILADFFVRKYDGKLNESESSSVSSNHSNGSKKESSKDLKKKKKKHKSKEKKSKHKHSSRRTSKSPKRSSEKHRSRSRSSNSYRSDRSRSPKYSHRYKNRRSRSSSYRSRSPRHSERHRSPRHSERHRSPWCSERYRSRSSRRRGKHKSRSPRRSRRDRSRSDSSSGRSPKHKSRYLRHTSAHEDKNNSQWNHGSASGSVECKKEVNQTKSEACSMTKEDRKSVIPLSLKSDDSSKAESIPVSSVCDKKDSNITDTPATKDSSFPKNINFILQNATELKLCNHSSCNVEGNQAIAAITKDCVINKIKTSSVNVNIPSNSKHCAKVKECDLSEDVRKSSHDKEVNRDIDVSQEVETELCEAPCDRNEVNENASNKTSVQVVADKCAVSVNKAQDSELAADDDAKTDLGGDIDSSNTKSNSENCTQMKTKIIFSDLKCSSFMKTLYNCDNIDLPKDLPQPKSSLNSDSTSASVSEHTPAENRLQKSSVIEKRHRSHTESSDRSSDSDCKSSPQDKKKRKHSKDKKHKHAKERKHKKKKKSHSKERSVSPKKSDGREKFDKAKLLSVARKNVLTMLEKGTLPQGIRVENLKHEQLISIKAGGKSVQELTEFCQALSKKEGDVDDNDDTDKDTANNDESDQPFIHHPFKLREQSVITMNIKNATQLPVKTHAEKVAENARLTLQFPVSSGSQHRQKEMEWVPVEKDDKKKVASTSEKKVAPKAPVKEGKKITESAVTAVTKSEAQISAVPLPLNETPNVTPFQPAVTPATQPPLPSSAPSLPPPLPPLPPPAPPPFVSPSSVVPSSYSQPVPFFPPEPETGSGHMFQASMMQPLTSPYEMSSSFMPAVPATAPVVNAFPTLSAKNIDLSAVVADRLKAVRKLQENPNDPEGLSLLHQSEQQLQAWVQSQQVPGKFTGSTDAKLLSAYELSGPNPVWARKNRLIHAAPVTEGKGMSLMKKMGWNPGEGLGKNKEGALEPLVLDIKTDKKGLVSEGEDKRKKPTIAYCHKHPVSVLAELCSKRKWTPPLYTCISETGPPHRRHFLFKVNVNNVDYQAKTSSPNKKLAKAQAAVLCLTAAGVTASEYIMPQ